MRVWGVGLGDMGFREDGFDYAEMDQTIERYLEVDPDAWLIVNFVFDARYQRWEEEMDPYKAQVGAMRFVYQPNDDMTIAEWRQVLANLGRKPFYLTFTGGEDLSDWAGRGLAQVGALGKRCSECLDGAHR